MTLTFIILLLAALFFLIFAPKKYSLILIKSVLAIFAMLLVLMIGFFAYNQGYNYLDRKDFFASKEEKFFYKKLKEFQDSKQESISLKELTNIEWDRLFYTMPYGGLGIGNDEELKKFKLNKNYSDEMTDAYGVERDDLTILILLNYKTMTGNVLALKRIRVNLEVRSNGDSLYPNSAIFRKCKQKNVYDFQSMRKNGKKDVKIVDYEYLLLTESKTCLLNKEEIAKLISEYKI